MSTASAMRLPLTGRRGRFFVRLLAVHLVLAAVLVPLGILLDPGEPWTAYALFGLVWWSFVVIAAARLGYVAAIHFHGAARLGMLLLGGCGLLVGGSLTFAETAIVSGFPPVVLPFTPAFIGYLEGAGLVCGGLLGGGIDWLWKLRVRAAGIGR